MDSVTPAEFLDGKRLNDSRRSICLAAGEIERVVDEAEAALIASDRGL